MSKRVEDIHTFLEHSLAGVAMPSRYIGGEINTTERGPEPDDLRFVLAFPEAYEIGMSHLGISILADITGRMPGVFVERAYAPWVDMESLMRREETPLFTLETKTPLCDVDVIGFSLMYELTYTNVVSMLELSGIPPLTADRTDGHPLIIGGGAAVYNPEPIADFFDVLFIGEADEAIEEIIEYLRDCPDMEKERLLRGLEKIDGVYVPRFFMPRYERGRFAGIARSPDAPNGPVSVSRRVVSDINRVPAPRTPVVPNKKAIHDRISVEIARGCGRGCRFCQAGFVYRPVRERDVDMVIDSALTARESTGMEEVSLLSLSSGDYGRIETLMSRLMDHLAPLKVALAVPSLRVGSLKREMMETILRVRKTGFTIAPEAGSQRLRDVINKNVTETEITDAVQAVFDAGWRLLKLYFMIGLPTETDEDLDELCRLVELVDRKVRRVKKGGLNVSVSTFVPKPHTPFQWQPALPIAETKRRQARISKRLKGLRASVKFHDAEMSYMEAVFARGDRRLSRAVMEAYRLGCRFDGWTERFDFSLWEEAFRRAGLSPSDYTEAAYDRTEPLPWSHIETGVTAAYLWEERRRAFDGVTTPDCASNGCTGCGVCGDGLATVRVTEAGETAGGSGIIPDTPEEDTERYRYLCVYSRSGQARFLSHLETASVIIRGMARAGLPLKYSEGFNPKPKVSFLDALPVGVETEGDPFVVELTERVCEDDLRERLSARLPRGIRLEAACAIAASGNMSKRYLQLSYRIALVGADVPLPDVDESIDAFLSRDEVWFEGGGDAKKKRINVRPFVESMEYHRESETLTFGLVRINGSAPSPYRVASALLGVRERDLRNCRVVKGESTSDFFQDTASEDVPMSQEREKNYTAKA
ncbi:MAG: TIGR03960 family B12-binding radical SAM protein [Deltaproteobacteria bacterium]|nr:TIGR03960 family B12-binding radical SAM protein [Candidatus Zymogenaceae bacterium]